MLPEWIVTGEGGRMAAYFITEIEITDPVRYEDYRAMVPPSLAAYGGRFIVRGGSPQSIEGDWQPKRVVVLAFDSVEQARAWYDSAEYRAAKALRLATANSRMILVEGV
jgi:uncharacterized protein (DUF1330 family)